MKRMWPFRDVLSARPPNSRPVVAFQVVELPVVVTEEDFERWRRERLERLAAKGKP